MLTYGIYDENDKVVGEYESMEEGLAALQALGDGDVTPYSHGAEGYYTEHYYLERGLYSRVCHGVSTLHIRDGAPVEPISAEDLGFIQSSLPADELLELLITLDTEKARALFDSLEPAPIIWDPEKRTMVLDFYYLETEDNDECDIATYYKCPPFNG